MRLLLFSINIDIDLAGDLSSKAKLFADDISLFSVMHDMTTSVNELNNDLKKISNLALRFHHASLKNIEVFD